MFRSLFVLLASAALAFAEDTPGVPAADAIQISLANRTDGPPRKQTLPPGFQGVLWGASPEVVQALRGRALEAQATPDPHLSWLIEWPIPTDEGQKDDIGVVRWRFWDHRLIEVHQFLPGELTNKEGVELVARFEQRYGASVAKEIKQTGHMAWGALVEDGLVEKKQWVWQDDFTLQFLHHDVAERQWVVVRQSRILESARTVQELREREMVKSSRVKNVTIE